MPYHTHITWGAERRVLGARAPTKFSEEILQWAGTHKVLAENVRGNGNFRCFTYSYNIHVTFWYTGYDGMTVHVQIYVRITHQHVHVHCTHTFPYFPLIFTHREKLMYVQLCTYISFFT